MPDISWPFQSFFGMRIWTSNWILIVNRTMERQSELESDKSLHPVWLEPTFRASKLRAFPFSHEHPQILAKSFTYRNNLWDDSHILSIAHVLSTKSGTTILWRNAELCVLSLGMSTRLRIPLTDQRTEIQHLCISICWPIFSGRSSRDCADIESVGEYWKN
jgi:hypothetical protein